MSLVPAPPPDANEYRRGLINTIAQRLAGLKDFVNPARFGATTTDNLPSGGTELTGFVCYDMTEKKLKVHDGTTWVPLLAAAGGPGSGSLPEHIASTEAHDSKNIVYSGNFQDMWDVHTVEAALNYLFDNVAYTNNLNSEYGASGVGTFQINGSPFNSPMYTPLQTVLEYIFGCLNDLTTSSLDQVSPTNLPLADGVSHSGDSFGNLTYAKDSGGWGHILGAVVWTEGFITNQTIGTLPSGCRPTKTVVIRTFATDYLNMGNDIENVVGYIEPDGRVWVSAIGNNTRVCLNFPSYKCA